jgi:SAM-dependent methyltransferase
MKAQHHNEKDTVFITQTLNNNNASYSLRAPPPPVLWNIRRITTLFFSVTITLPWMVLASLLWCIASILLPNGARNRLLAYVLPRIMQSIDDKLKTERQTLLLGNTNNSMTTVGGIVLDVGSGGGAYLQYCKQAKQVIALEPNESLHKYIQRAGDAAELNSERLIIVKSMEEVKAIMKATEVSYLDWILLGNVLCEVPSVSSTLQEVHKLLRPNTGRLYFCEHIGCQQGSWRRWIQDCINPLWRHLSGGCNCNRDSVDLIQQRFDRVILWRYTHIKGSLAPFVIGLAMKEGKSE